MFVLEMKDWKVVNKLEFAAWLFGKTWKFIIRLFTKKRTNAQNSYLHAIFDMIAKDTWTGKDYVKYIMKMKFLTIHKYKLPHTLDTHNLDTIKFNEFVENILNFMSTFWSKYIYPTPEEYKQWVRR